MFLFYVISFFKKGDTIQGGTLFKGGKYMRKYGICICISISIYFNISYPEFELQLGFNEFLKFHQSIEGDFLRREKKIRILSRNGVQKSKECNQNDLT